MVPCLEDGIILYEKGVTHSEIRNILHKFWYEYILNKFYLYSATPVNITHKCTQAVN